MTWEGRSSVPVGLRMLGAGLAIGAAVTAAALLRPEMILLLVVAIPAVLLATRARAAQVTLEGSHLTTAWRGRRPQRVELGTRGGPRPALCRWTGPAAGARGLALRFPSARETKVIIGAATKTGEHLGRGRVLPPCGRVDVVLSARHFGELAHALAPGLEDTAVAAVLAPETSFPVFALWENPRFPLAFLGACLGTIALAALARFVLGFTTDALMTRAGGAVPYGVAVVLGAGIVFDVRAAWARRSPALSLSARAGELIVRKTGWPATVTRAPLHAVRVKKGTWERPQADMPERDRRRLPMLKVTVKPGTALTIGAGGESSDPRMAPAPERSTARMRLPEMKPPRYLALAEDWASLVEVLTAVDLQTSL